MPFFVKVQSLLRNLFMFRRVEVDLDQEVHSHFEMLTEENIREGMSQEEAQRAARMELGGIEQLKEQIREGRIGNWFRSVISDCRYGLRQLGQAKGFTAVAVMTIALGTGANTAIFSVVQGVLFAPLPFTQPDRVVLVLQKNLKQNRVAYLSYQDFLDWQRNARAFQQMAAVKSGEFDLTSPGLPEHLEGNEVSAGFFNTLGMKLALGRDLAPQEDTHGGAPVVIISNRLWKSRFAGDSAALGKSVTLNGMDYTIVGVLPPEFRSLWAGPVVDVYVPVAQGDPLILNDRRIHSFASIARLKPEVSMVQAQDEMTVVQANIDRLYPTLDQGLGADVQPLKQSIVGDVRPTLLLLLGAVGVVLLIACANVANLLLARSAVRAREFAIRSALGANRARIVRQLITESVLLSFAGSALGLVAAKWGLGAVLAAVPGILPRSENIGVNVSVLFFAFGISLAVGIVSGLVPAFKSSKAALHASLKEGGRGASGAHHRSQGSLVMVQMALTLVLLVGAGLLFRTIRHLGEVDPGFDARQVLTFKVGLSPALSKTPASMRIAYNQLAERLRQVPGVKAADLTALVPLTDTSNSGPFWVGSHAPASLAEAPRALFFWTGLDYLRAMGIPLLRGRFFTAEDTTRSDPVIVIDSALAHAYFPDQDPVGQTVMIPHWHEARIIGVVGHVKHWDLSDSLPYSQNQIYISLDQMPDEYVPVFYSAMTVIVRTPSDTAMMMPTLNAEVLGIGTDQTVYDVQTMQQIVSHSMTAQRFPMILLAELAALALLLASIGIYGTISYSVAQRVREIGIRMALGAEKRDVFQLVLGQGIRLAFAGVAIGAATASILSRLLSSFSNLLHGVGTGDPATFALVSLTLLAVSVLACYLPARRAMRVDPTIALRYE
jgi:predicted permease